MPRSRTSVQTVSAGGNPTTPDSGALSREMPTAERFALVSFHHFAHKEDKALFLPWFLLSYETLYFQKCEMRYIMNVYCNTCACNGSSGCRNHCHDHALESSQSSRVSPLALPPSCHLDKGSFDLVWHSNLSAGLESCVDLLTFLADRAMEQRCGHYAKQCQTSATKSRHRGRSTESSGIHTG